MKKLTPFPLLGGLVLLTIGTLVFVAGSSANLPTKSANPGAAAGAWPSEPPAHCPFHASKDFTGIAFTGRHKEYGNADTWYLSWAADDAMYSPWTDGYIDGVKDYRPFSEKYPGYPCNSVDYRGRKAATAQAKILGSDPLQLSIVNLPPRIEASASPYGGRYPAGSLVYGGVWYYGTYSLAEGAACGGVGWTLLGPFVGFRYSTDSGKSWTETPHTPANPLFGENPKAAPIKIGSPHFVDFGKNMQSSPDGKAYLVAHGSTDHASCNDWIQGDQVYLLRVSPSISHMNNSGAYEFFGGLDSKGDAIWTHNFSEIKPLVEWGGRLGCVTMTWNAGLKKYFMCITRGVVRGHHDTMVLVSNKITGPWDLVTYMKNFGPEAYFVNIPSKFISADGKTAWLCYSANWSDKASSGNPNGSRYALCLHEIRLLTQ